MSKLKLITTENFGDLQCNFYRNMNDDILLTREQIGTALEYADPSKAIQKIHLKHKDRLDSLSVRIKSSTTTDLGGGRKSNDRNSLLHRKRNYGIVQMVSTAFSQPIHGLGVGHCGKIS